MEYLNPLEIENLLAKLRKSTISEEELVLLKANLDREGDTLENAWKEHWNNWDHSDADFDQVKDKIYNRLDTDRALSINQKKKNIQRYSVAAAVVFLIVSGFLFSTITSKKWTDLKNTTLAISEIKLPDESTVWLTPGSTIKYSHSFGKEDRVVLLNGQARFDVTTDSSRTFLVKTEFVETKVLGTNFTVYAYDNVDEVEVALHEGGVQVQVSGNTRTTNLFPGEKLLYQKTSGNIFKNKIKNTERFNWQDGIIRFNKANVAEVKNRLEEWYGVNIAVEGDTSVYEKLIYRIDTRKLNFEKVIAGIDLVSNYSIHKTGTNTYVIKKKK